MPPQDQARPDPLNPPKGASPVPEGNTPPLKPGIDPKSVLLPKKETPGQTPQSAQRINAGALLQQEQTAGKEGLAKPEAAPQPAVPAAAPTAPKQEESTVQPLETYKSDIERLVQDKNVSVVSIAAAEAQRRGSGSAQAVEPSTPASPKAAWARTGMIVGATLILVVGAGLLAYVFTPRTVPEQASAPQAPFILVDGNEVVSLTPGESGDAYMNDLNGALQKVSLSLGLMERLIPATASTTESGAQETAMDAQTFLSTIAPDAPQDLVRNIDPTFLLGVHVYNGNQPFLIFKVDSYESAYSGMLAWEPSLRTDLLPLFSYTPLQHIPEEGVGTTTPPTQVLDSDFVDQIVENHDARVLENSTGDIYLLWTFLDRNTLVITTNSATLREIISRLQSAPVTPIPGQ